MSIGYLEAFERSIPRHSNPKLKPFDLQVGDKVKQIVRRDHGSDSVEIKIYTYTVKAIFPYVMLCENRWGEKTTFSKVDYQTGVITKGEVEPDAYY